MNLVGKYTPLCINFNFQELHNYYKSPTFVISVEGPIIVCLFGPGFEPMTFLMTSRAMSFVLYRRIIDFFVGLAVRGALKHLEVEICRYQVALKII